MSTTIPIYLDGDTAQTYTAKQYNGSTLVATYTLTESPSGHYSANATLTAGIVYGFVYFDASGSPVASESITLAPDDSSITSSLTTLEQTTDSILAAVDNLGSTNNSGPIPPATLPGVVNVYAYIDDSYGNPLAAATLYYRMAKPPATTGIVWSYNPIAVESDEYGLVAFDLYIGATYLYWYGDSDEYSITITGDVNPLALPTIIGQSCVTDDDCGCD